MWSGAFLARMTASGGPAGAPRLPFRGRFDDRQCTRPLPLAGPLPGMRCPPGANGRYTWCRRLLPALSQMGLHREGARSHVRPDLIPHERAVGEAQCGIGPDVEGEMGVKGRRII